MKLSSIEVVKEVRHHHNADSLDIVKVLGYECITLRDAFSVGDRVVFIAPDSVLPVKPWSEMFRKRSSRVRAIKLRDAWSFGIVLDGNTVGIDVNDFTVGSDISDILGVYKYEPPTPQDLSAAGYLPTGLPKTDEERYQNLEDTIPYDELVDVTLKIDGSSATYFCIVDHNTGETQTGTCSRSLVIKDDCENNYTRIEKRYNILHKLKEYCLKHNVSLALRGEIYGGGIQGFEGNPHGKLPVDFAAFSVYNIDKHKYTAQDEIHSTNKLCKEFNIPIVPTLERTTLTREIIEKYSSGIDKINGVPFEGVVIKGVNRSFSFKIINMAYDQKK